MSNQKLILSVIGLIAVFTVGYMLVLSTNQVNQPIGENANTGDSEVIVVPGQNPPQNGDGFNPPVLSGPCYVGGCSSQICSDQPGAISTCEYREEYACYQSAKCERQSSGQCGWTPSATLNACLSASN
ncbi:MAG: hypothetical protein WD991_01255 [Candidatus Paceibacterota bacterium]